MKEVIEMKQVLLEIGTDTYLKCKYMFLASSREEPTVNAFFKVLFGITDRERPLLIEMRGGNVV